MAKVVVRIISFALYLLFVTYVVIPHAIVYRLEWRNSPIRDQDSALRLMLLFAALVILWAMHISLVQIWQHRHNRTALISRLSILVALFLSPYLLGMLPGGQSSFFIPLFTSLQMLICAALPAFAEILLSSNQFKAWCRKALDPLFFINLLGAVGIWFIAYFLFIEQTTGWAGLAVMVFMLYGSLPILLFLGLLLVFLERALKKLWAGRSQLEYSHLLAGLLQAFLVMLILALSILAVFTGFRWGWDWSVLLKISGAMLLWSLLVVTGQNWINRHRVGKKKAKREV